MMKSILILFVGLMVCGCADENENNLFKRYQKINQEQVIGELYKPSCVMDNCYMAWYEIKQSEILEKHAGEIKIQKIYCLDDGSECHSDSPSWFSEEDMTYYSDKYQDLKNPIEARYKKMYPGRWFRK